MTQTQHWEYRTIRVDAGNAEPSVSWDSLIHREPHVNGNQRPSLAEYLNGPATNGAGPDITTDWEVCGVLSGGGYHVLVLKRPL